MIYYYFQNVAFLSNSFIFFNLLPLPALQQENLMWPNFWRLKLCKIQKRRSIHFLALTNSSSAAALPPPSVSADTVTTDSISLSFSFHSQYEVGALVRLLNTHLYKPDRCFSPEYHKVLMWTRILNLEFRVSQR